MNMGRKKQEYFVQVRLDGKLFKIPVDVKKSSYRSWTITKYGFLLVSAGGDGVAVREEALNEISGMMQQIVDGDWIKKTEGLLNIIEVSWATSYQYRIEFKNWKSEDKSFPEWKRGNAVIKGGQWAKYNVLHVLERWIEENGEAIAINKISKKFGL